MLSALSQRDFALAWTGGLTSMVGTWALWIALPLHVYILSGSALATSGVLVAVVVPGIVFGTVAGVYVDRWDRKRTLIVGNLLLAVAFLPLIAVQDESRLWIVYPVVLVASTIGQFTDAAENAFLPKLVRTEDLIAANSLNALNNNLARLIGPVVGGGTYAAAGIGGVVAIDAASFVVAAALLALVRATGAIEAATEAAGIAVRGWRRMWTEWRDGLRIVRRERAVSVMFTVQAIAAIGEGVFGVMFVIWVRDVLEGGAPELGWLHTAQAAGGLIGGIVGTYAGRRLAPERLGGVALLVFGLLDLMLFNYPLVLDGVWIGLGLMVLVGIPTVSAGAARQTILQTHVEDAYRGRVFGSLATTASLLMLAGTLLAGAVGGFVGPIAMLNIQGGAYVACGVFVLLTLGSVAAPARTPEPAAQRSG